MGGQTPANRQHRGRPFLGPNGAAGCSHGWSDAADCALIDNGFGFQGADPALRNWANGDMNFDGAIDAADYALIDNAFNFQSGVLASAMEAAPLTVSSDVGASVVGTPATGGSSSAVTPAPEPGTMALLVLGGLALLPVRRNRPRMRAA